MGFESIEEEQPNIVYPCLVKGCGGVLKLRTSDKPVRVIGEAELYEVSWECLKCGENTRSEYHVKCNKKEE